MKYLKLFEAFDGLSTDEMTKIHDECNDILMEIRDLGIEVLIEFNENHYLKHKLSKGENKLTITIGKRSPINEKFILYDKIVANIDHLISYLNSIDFRLDDIDGIGERLDPINTIGRRFIIRSMGLDSKDKISYLKMIFIKLT